MTMQTGGATSGHGGLAALVMLLRIQGLSVDPAQIRHQFGTDAIGVPEMLRCARQLGLKARESKTQWDRLARTPLPGIATLRDGGFLLLGKASEDKILVQAPDSARPKLMTRAEFEAVWDGRLVLMTRRAGTDRPRAALRRHLVPGRDPQISRPVGRGAGRLVLSPDLCADLAAVLPGRHRQGPGASQHEHARRADDRAGRDRPLRDRSRRPADLPVLAHDQSDRRGAGRQAVPPSPGVADRLFPGAPRGRFRGPGARAREHPQLPDQFGADARDRPVLHVRLSRGHVFLFSAAHLDRARLASVLHRDFGRDDTPVPATAGREISPWRGKPGVSRRMRLGRGDPQVHGGRAADAAPLGGAARRLRGGELPRAEPWQHFQPGRAVHQQAGHGGDPLLWGKAGDRRRPHRRRTGRLQHAGRPRQPAGAAPRPDLARLPSGARVGRTAGRYPQHPGRADLQSEPHGAAPDPRRRHVRACHLPLSHRRSGDPARRQPEGAGRSD